MQKQENRDSYHKKIEARRAVEYWKYLRIQMLWLFIIGFLCGLYEVLMGLIGIFVLEIDVVKQFMVLKCINGITGNQTKWNAKSMPAEMFLTLHVVIIMFYSTIYYIVFFFIPFKFDRIKKNLREVYYFFIYLFNM